jgi:hypothetical protein
MIPFGTVLSARGGGESVRVIAVEGGRYVIEPAEFGAPTAIGVQDLVDAYDVGDLRAEIGENFEADAWRRLSREKYSDYLARSRGSGRKAAALPTPEQVFARAAADDH